MAKKKAGVAHLSHDQFPAIDSSVLLTAASCKKGKPVYGTVVRTNGRRQTVTIKIRDEGRAGFVQRKIQVDQFHVSRDGSWVLLEQLHRSWKGQTPAINDLVVDMSLTTVSDKWLAFGLIGGVVLSGQDSQKVIMRRVKSLPMIKEEYPVCELLPLIEGVWVAGVKETAKALAAASRKADTQHKEITKTPTEPIWGTVVIDDASLGKTQELTCKAAALYTVTGVCGDPTDNDRLVTLTYVELDGGTIERTVRMSTRQLKYDEERKMWVYFDKPEVKLPNVDDTVINGDLVVNAGMGLCDVTNAVMRVKSVTRGSPINSPSIVFESCNPALPDLALVGGEVTSKTVVYSKKSDIWFIWPSRIEMKPAAIPTKTKITVPDLCKRGWTPSLDASGAFVHPSHPDQKITLSPGGQYVFLEYHTGATTRVDTMEELDKIFPDQVPPTQRSTDDPRLRAVSMYEAQSRPK